MGITGLWDVLGEGEVWHIADYAADFFKKHHRPLRIAVDEACWRFRNLNAHQVESIREGEAAANPIEKVILQRIYRLLRLNIQLIFVDDGVRRPRKRGKAGGGKLDYELKKLTRQLLSQLKVPHHEAPGEAEAECARMQALGIVDVVWSDDGDSFMFGCGTLMKHHKQGNTNVKDHVRIYCAEEIRRKHDLDSESLVLFALLSGGDYVQGGLRGFGPIIAAQVAQRSNGIAKELCHASRSDLVRWREHMDDVLRRYGKAGIPLEFPDFKALENYRHPKVSTDEQLRNLRGLKDGWDRKIDQRSLRVFLRHNFNFKTPEFLRHIMPILVARRLARAILEQKAENVELGIQLKRTRKVKVKEREEEPPATSEVKIWFSPTSVAEIELGVRPHEEDWSKFAAKDGSPYDPTRPVECELLDCFLKHGLPEGALVEAPPPARKQKRKDGMHGDGETASSSKRRKPSLACDEGKTKKKPGRPRRDGLSQGGSKAARSKKGKEFGTRSPSPPPATFQMPTGLAELRARTGVVDLCNGSDSEDDDGGSQLFISEEEDDDPDLEHAIRLSLTEDAAPDGPLADVGANSRRVYSGTVSSSRSTKGFLTAPLTKISSAQSNPTISSSASVPPLEGISPRPRPTRPVIKPPTKERLVPGQSISAQTLRDLRMSSALLKTTQLPPTETPLSCSVAPTSGAPAMTKVPEVIDLT